MVSITVAHDNTNDANTLAEKISQFIEHQSPGVNIVKVTVEVVEDVAELLRPPNESEREALARTCDEFAFNDIVAVRASQQNDAKQTTN